jgi:glucose-fructose oxidoreductase
MTENTRFTRREMIAAAGALPLAASAGRALAQEAEGQPLLGNPALPDPPGARMGWAIVGLGTFAVGQVIPRFGDARQSKLAAFVSGNPDKARELGQRYGVDRFYTYDTYNRMADDPSIQCVFIALPVGLHAEYTIRALEAGKHVLCEKPMASTSAECEAMIAAAKANDRQLGVAYRVHFEPVNREALRRIREGEIGAMRYVQCDHGFNASLQWPPHQWRLQKALGGGGSMYDVGVYGINTSLMMLEGHPVEVSAAYAYPADDPRVTEVEGGIDWRMRMSTGINVQGSSSYCYAPYASRQRYFGSEGSIITDPATTYDGNSLVMEGGGGPRREIGTGSSAQQFAAQVDGFSQAARENRPHLTPGEMGLRDIRIIEAMYRSADNGGVVVKL